MPKLLFIADHRLNRSPSQRYRFEQYLSYFKSQGWDWELSEIINETDDAIFYGKGQYLRKAWVLFKSIFIRLRDLNKAKGFDTIFIQREALLLGSSFFEKQFYKKSKVVFDFDDSIWLLDTSPENKKFEFLKNPQKTRINIQNAHVVIAGNTFLASYAKNYNPNTFVIPTTINTDIHRPLIKASSSDDKVIIGWSGSLSTIKHFELAIPALIEIQRIYPVEIHVIGQGSYSHPELNVVSKYWNAQSEVDDLNCFDIGIMPLPDDEWVKGKCGLKGLSYMACGVATIMSPVGVNSEIIQHEVNGLLANTKEEWVSCLSRLIENKQLRTLLGDAGRETVVKNYSVNAHKDSYLSILNSLIK